MLDQNTDRMWYVIGAVLVGAAIILIANGTMPDMFASVTGSFEEVSGTAIAGINEINRYGPNIVIDAHETHSAVQNHTTRRLRNRFDISYEDIAELAGETIEVSFDIKVDGPLEFTSYILDFTPSANSEKYKSSRHTIPGGVSHKHEGSGWQSYSYTAVVKDNPIDYGYTSITVAADNTTLRVYFRNPVVRHVRN